MGELSYSRRSVALASITMVAQGIIVLVDGAVRVSAAWNVLRPYTTAIGIVLIVVGLLVAIGPAWPPVGHAGPWLALAVTSFLAFFFLVNAWRYDGAGVAAAVWWAMLGGLVFEMVLRKPPVDSGGG